MGGLAMRGGLRPLYRATGKTSPVSIQTTARHGADGWNADGADF